MRFSEWSKKLDAQQKRLNEIALSDVSETLCVNDPVTHLSTVITITIGKGKYETLIDGSAVYGLRYLRPFYTNNKEEFNALLEEITEAVDKVAEATEAVLTELSSEIVPQAVIKRMKGEQQSGDPGDLVKEMAGSRLTSLWKKLDSLGLKAMVFKTFDIVVPIAGRNLHIEMNYNSFNLGWGRIRFDSVQSRIHIDDAEEAMYFIANFELIERRVLEIVRQLKAIS